MLVLFISWVYKQAVVHEDEEKNIMADRKEYSPDNRTKKTSPQKWVTVFEIFVVRLLFSASGLGSSPGRDIVLCPWAFTLTVPLSAQGRVVRKAVNTNPRLKVNWSINFLVFDENVFHFLCFV